MKKQLIACLFFFTAFTVNFFAQTEIPESDLASTLENNTDSEASFQTQLDLKDISITINHPSFSDSSVTVVPGSDVAKNLNELLNSSGGKKKATFKPADILTKTYEITSIENPFTPSSVVSLVLKLIGYLGLLLYGMKLMSDGVQKSAGEKLQRALSVVTGNRFLGLLTGLLITMIIQSSGATTAMVVTFVNAGLMSLYQSVGVIFGANIGTTITAWIVSIFGFNFKISTFAIPVVGIGFFITKLKKSSWQNIGVAIMGFGLLFLGLDGLSGIFTPAQLGGLFDVFTSMKVGVPVILLSFLIGAFITALLHSSSAYSAIVITMAYNGLISWEIAAAMTLGSNIGSTIDAVFAAWGGSADAKRSALIHVLFNVIGTTLALIFFKPFLQLIIILTPGHENSNIAIRISMLHTIFKTLSTIIFLPFTHQLTALVTKIIKDDKVEQNNTFTLEFSDTAGLGKENYATYIIRAEKAVSDMADQVTELFDILQIGMTKRDKNFVAQYSKRADDIESYVDQIHEKLTNYLVKCETLELSEKQVNHISVLIQIVEELENMTDSCYATNCLILRSIDKKMKFPQEDIEKILPYIELARQFILFVRKNINTPIDQISFDFVRQIETDIDFMCKELKKIARKRLENGADVKSELLYIDVVRRIENIGDNCFNISEILAKM